MAMATAMRACEIRFHHDGDARRKPGFARSGTRPGLRPGLVLLHRATEPDLLGFQSRHTGTGTYIPVLAYPA